MKKLLFRIAGILAMLSAPLFISTAVRAANVTWDGGGTDNNWSTAANWSGDTLPVDGDVLIFDMTVPTTYGEAMNNDLTSLNVAGITLTGAGTTNKSYVVTGNNLIISGPITGTQSSGGIVLDLNVSLGSSVVYSVPGVAVSFGSYTAPVTTFDLGAFNFTLADTSTEACEILNLYSALKGTGNITTNAGSSAVILYEPADTYSGNVTINGLGLSIYADALYMNSTVTMNGSSRLMLSASAVTLYDINIVMNSSADPALVATTSSFRCVGGATPETITIHAGSLTLQRATIFGGENNLIIDGTFTPNGHALTTQSGSSGAVTTSAGTVSAPSVTTTIEPTDIDAGAFLSVGNNQTIILKGQRGTVNVNSGGVLKGTGTTGALLVFAGGTLAPGLSPGCINSGDLNLAAGTYQVELEDLTACTEYDQTKVTGTVTLGGTLQIVRFNNMVPRINNSFKIIDNDGTDAVTGTFAGLAQGATTVVDGITYSISYTGGDGNDVVLVVTAVNSSLGAPNTGAHVIKSGIILPIFAILSAIAIFGMNYMSTKKK